MATNFDADNVLSHTRWSQIVFLTIAVVFNLCLVAQVLTVGLAFFYSPEWWNIHVWLVRGYQKYYLLTCHHAQRRTATQVWDCDTCTKHGVNQHVRSALQTQTRSFA